METEKRINEYNKKFNAQFEKFLKGSKDKLDAILNKDKSASEFFEQQQVQLNEYTQFLKLYKDEQMVQREEFRDSLK